MKTPTKTFALFEPEYSCSPFGYLKNIPLFSNLSNEEIAFFEKAALIRTYKKGKILYLQGDEPKFFYIIGGGWIKLFRTMPEGDEVIVDMLTTGHMFGENAIFEQDHHMCSAQVVENVRVLIIPATILKEQIRHNPKIAFNMLSFMSRQHRHHVSAMAFNTMLSAPQRIGCFLLQLCPIGGNGKHIAFNLPYDKTLIADTLGMKGATFSRALNLLRKKTHIRIEGTSVIIDSVPELARFVYGSLGTQYISADM